MGVLVTQLAPYFALFETDIRMQNAKLLSFLVETKVSGFNQICGETTFKLGIFHFDIFCQSTQQMKIVLFYCKKL